MGKARGAWYDALYMSKFPTVSETDIRLLTVPRKSELNKNESYTVEFELELPLKIAAGQYFIIFVADTKRVLPDINRDNNEDSVKINIYSTPNVDLFVSNTSINESLDFLNFYWYLNADRGVAGKKCERFYLSYDQTLNYNDFEIKTSSCDAFEIRQLTPNKTAQLNYENHFGKTFMIPDGDYYGIVKAITNVQESNFANNIGISDKQYKVSVPSLQINKVNNVTLNSNMNHIYKLEPSANMNRIKIELSSNSKTAYHDIFIYMNTIQSENDFVASSLRSFSFNQTAILRNVHPEKYYIMIKSYMAQVNQIYNVNVMVKEIKDVDIDFIESTKLSRLGKTTIKIVGNFIPEDLSVSPIYTNAYLEHLKKL